jgi:hypothetical protein
VSYKVSPVAKTYRLFAREATYEYKSEETKKKYKTVIALKPFGCIPAKMRVADIKCSSERLEKQILQVLGQNESALVLPKTPNDWKAMSDEGRRETFKTLCQDVRAVLEEL